MIYLADTNVLLRYSDRLNPLRPTIRKAVRKLRLAGHGLRACFQNFVEFWNVATRPLANNGLGWNLSKAHRYLQRIERMFDRLQEGPPVYDEWRRLVIQYQISGVKVHDARLVASMLVHGITHILTFNIADFARYVPEGIVAVDPATA